MPLLFLSFSLSSSFHLWLSLRSRIFVGANINFKHLHYLLWAKGVLIKKKGEKNDTPLW